MSRWSLRLDAWIIQDGNYGDFEVGSSEPFAVELLPLGELAVTEPGREGTADPRGASHYSISAPIVYRDEAASSLVLDVGFLAYYVWRERGPAPDLGAWVTGIVELGVDPFDYFEGMAGLPGFPPLIYGWAIDGILLETTPWVEVADRYFQRDPDLTAFRAVEKTNAWEDDDRNASYVLECTLSARPPQSTKGAARRDRK